MNIIGKTVKLRAVEIDDLELLNKWANDPEIWYMLGGWHFPYSKNNTEKWIKILIIMIRKIKYSLLKLKSMD